jgi:hypothetical protein
MGLLMTSYHLGVQCIAFFISAIDFRLEAVLLVSQARRQFEAASLIANSSERLLGYLS